MLTSMRTSILRFKLLWSLYRIGRNPEATDKVFDVSDALSKINDFAETFKKLSDSPPSQRLISERKLLAPIDLHKLVTLPEGSLGHTYGTHMLQNKLNPNFYRNREIIDDKSYIMMRMRQTHDLWHVVTGFDTTVPGEVALQAFMLSQMRARLSPLLVGGAIMRTGLDRPEAMHTIMSAVTKGFTMGEKAELIFPFDWENNWERPLDEIRRELNINV